MINVLIFNEFAHEQKHDRIRAIYPTGIHGCIRDFLQTEEDINVETVTLFNEDLEVNDLEAIITDEKLANTDVIMWWGHAHHGKVPDEVAKRVQNAVLGGMGAVFLHSGHHSKPFKLLMGTTCNVDWREDGDLCRVWVTDPSHPITQPSSPPATSLCTVDQLHPLQYSWGFPSGSDSKESTCNR